MGRALALAIVFATLGVGTAMAQEVGAVAGPAPVIEALKGDEPLEPVVVSVSTGPSGKVSGVEAMERLPTEEELQAEAMREAEARRPPPLKPRHVPQRVDVLSPGRMIVVPRERPVEGGTLSGQMFNDDVETLQPVATPAMMLEPLIGQMNLQAEAMERVMAGMEARLDAIGPSASTSETAVSTTEVVTPTEVIVAKPEPLPKALTLPFVGDVTGLGPANSKKLAVWLEKIGPARTVKMRITAHVLEPNADGLGEDPAKLAQARAAAVKAAVAKAGVQASGKVAVVVLRIKAGEVGGQRLVVKVTE
jgi:outer membrane protein OmpA-like peptidoglycan-associated protein